MSGYTYHHLYHTSTPYVNFDDADKLRNSFTIHCSALFLLLFLFFRRLVPAARYYPLKFHCIRSLNMLAEATDTFVPVAPFLLEVS